MVGVEDSCAVGVPVVTDLDELAESYASRLAGLAPLRRRQLRDDLVSQLVPFARRVASRYRNRGEPTDDLEQVACVGLVKAVDRYDPECGSFTAFALTTISGELKRHFRDRTWGVHVPRRLQELSLAIGQSACALTHQLSRSPTVAELAEYLGATQEDVLEAMESAAGYTPASLNAPLGDGGHDELGDLLGSIDGDLARVDDRLTVASLLCLLPARERRILALRFYGNHTQTEIAAQLGISQMHVSRLLSRTLGWLRDAMLSDAPGSWTASVTQPAYDNRLDLLVSTRLGTVTVRIVGEIDRDNADQVRTAVLTALGSDAVRQVIVDVAAVSFIDAAGVGALISAREGARVRGTKLHLVGLQPQVARLIAVTGGVDAEQAGSLPDRRVPQARRGVRR